MCCYWLEKARGQIETGATIRAGLLATQAVRFQSNRRALTRIKETGDIFAAYGDLEWKPEEPDSAAVHVSIICFDDGSESERVLDGQPIATINVDLSSGADLTQWRSGWLITEI